MTSWRHIVRELSHRKQELFIILGFLSLTLFGVFFVTSFQEAVENYRQQQAQEALAADLVVRSLHPIEALDLAALQEEITPRKSSQMLSFRTVLYNEEASVFTRVKAIDSGYPLIGSILTDPAIHPNELQNSPYVWIDEGLQTQLQLQRGDHLQIGSQEFTVQAIIEEDSTATFSPLGVASYIYIGKNWAAKTGLVGPGSQISYNFHYTLDDPTVAASLAQRLEERWPDYSFRTTELGAFAGSRALENFELILSIISLFVILLCFLSSFYLFQIYLQERLQNTLILLCYGAKKSSLYKIYFTQMMMISIIACFFGMLLFLGAIQFTNHFFEAYGLTSLQLRFSPITIGLTLVVALFIGLLFIIPFFRNLKSAQSTNLFQDNLGLNFSISWIPLVVGVVLLALLFLPSYWYGTFVLLGVLAFGFLTVGGYWLFFRAFYPYTRQWPLYFRLSWAHLARAPLNLRLCSILLVFIVFLLQAVPHFYQSLSSEMRAGLDADAPEFFVFNLEEAEIDPLESYLEEQGARLDHLSPMVMGRVRTINDEPAQDRLGSSPVRLTYRQNLFDSERVIQGTYTTRPYDPHQQEIAHLSVEERYAERNDLHLGDKIGFEILGLEVVAQVTSIRSIDWLQFHPNFFLQFQPGVIDAAPSSYLAGVHRTQSTETASQIFYDLRQNFPHISLISISDMVEQGRQVLSQTQNALFLLSVFIIALCVLISVVLMGHHIRRRYYEISLYRLLGAKKKDLSRIFLMEYLSLASVSWIMGSLLAGVLTFLIMHFGFTMSTELNLAAMLYSLLLILLMMTALVLFVVRRPINELTSQNG